MGRITKWGVWGVFFLAVALSGCQGETTRLPLLEPAPPALPAPPVLPGPVPSAEPSPVDRGVGEGNWRVEYDGFGSVRFDEDGLEFAPAAARSPEETHAVLLLSKAVALAPLRDFRAQLRVATLAQLRTPVPNDWEVFWLFFNYTVDARGKKRTAYVAVKPSGIELGLAFDEVGQTFLATTASGARPVGVAYDLEVLKQGQRLRVWVDAELALDYRGGGLYDEPGNVGLYSEDARVRVESARFEPAP
jgi:hypothetical protein